MGVSFSGVKSDLQNSGQIEPQKLIILSVNKVKRTSFAKEYIQKGAQRKPFLVELYLAGTSPKKSVTVAFTQRR